jgi:hypothetical protein
MGKPRKWDMACLEPAVKDSINWAEVCVRLGLDPLSGSQCHIKRQAVKAGIDFKHFPGKHVGGFAKKPRVAQPLESRMIENSTIKSSELRRRLIKSGLKEAQCEGCGLREWLGKPIPLELDHVNGEHTDCRFENLKILCPNCHAVKTLYTGLAEQPDAALLESAALVA